MVSPTQSRHVSQPQQHVQTQETVTVSQEKLQQLQARIAELEKTNSELAQTAAELEGRLGNLSQGIHEISVQNEDSVSEIQVANDNAAAIGRRVDRVKLQMVVDDVLVLAGVASGGVIVGSGCVLGLQAASAKQIVSLVATVATMVGAVGYKVSKEDLKEIAQITVQVFLKNSKASAEEIYEKVEAMFRAKATHPQPTPTIAQ